MELYACMSNQDVIKAKASHAYHVLVLIMTTYEDEIFYENLWRYNLTLKHKDKEVCQEVKGAPDNLYKSLPLNKDKALGFNDQQ